ncbi:hypothetical protein LCGC14_1052290, partial [marine sediment metagenome]
MKEELQTALAELISKTLSGVDAGKEFLTAEIPDVLSQLLMWYGVSNFIESVIGAVLFGIGFKILRGVFTNKRNVEWTDKGDITGPELREILRGCLGAGGIFVSTFY